VRSVSDLIGRIAARAVGAPALAQPRVAAPLLGTGGLEVVDEEIGLPRNAPPAAVAEPGRAVPAPAASPADEAEAATPLVEDPPAAASQGPAAERRSRRERHLPALERDSVDPTEAPLAAPAAEPRVVAQAVPADAVPAADTPAAPALPAHRGATAAHGYTGPAGPPPVRVHIGRLEVRANVQEQHRAAAPPPQPAEPEGLSLSDYLRGRR
jgi:hypothetical protein